jgi:hypothetical protein
VRDAIQLVRIPPRRVGVTGGGSREIKELCRWIEELENRRHGDAKIDS